MPDHAQITVPPPPLWTDPRRTTIPWICPKCGHHDARDPGHSHAVPGVWLPGRGLRAWVATAPCRPSRKWRRGSGGGSRLCRA